MTRETVDGRAVFLRKTRHGWAVKWGRTIVGHYKSWREAVSDIIELYKE